MEKQWNYQLSIDGAIIQVPRSGQLLQKTHEVGFYNHLAAALEGLLQLNMYGFDSQFGPAREEQKWNRLYNSAAITSVETGKPIVSMLNLPIADRERNPFLHPGLYLSFDIGIARFEKLAGLSLEQLEPMDYHTARLARYEYTEQQRLAVNPGLKDLQLAIALKRDNESLEQYRLSLKGRPEATTYHLTNYHYHNFPDSFAALLRVDLRRLEPGSTATEPGQHAIGWAGLDYGSKAIPVASLIREDKSKDQLVLPGAYIFTTSDPADIERHAGVDLSGLSVHRNGNLRYLKIASLSPDGKTLQPFEALQKIRDELSPAGAPPFSLRYHYQSSKGIAAATGDSTTRDRTFSTLYSAMMHFLSINKDMLGKPYLDDRLLSSVELIDNKHGKTVGHLFRQKTSSGELKAGDYLKIDPAYLNKAFGENESPLKYAQRIKDLHIVLAPFAEKSRLKKHTPTTSRRRKPPPGAGSKTP